MPKPLRSLRLLVALVLVVPPGVALSASTADAASSGRACTPTVLVLSAMPLELSPLIRQTTLDSAQTTTVNGRTFYAGSLAGKRVVLAMTGIGPVNAQETATAAFEHFRCPFSAALFSGVAGSKQNIADAAIPRRWTIDNGKTWTAVDASLLKTAMQLKGTEVPLSRDVPVGDAACLCAGVTAGVPIGVRVPQTPKVVVGGDGATSDPFGGKAIPCLPGGGDIAGCAPCLLPAGTARDAATFADNAPKMLDPKFFGGLLQPTASTTATDSEDEETAAVAIVARKYRVPFLGIRGVSDGQNDPLHLPGFPAQFFVYRQLAANNAAAVTVVLLRAHSFTKR